MQTAAKIACYTAQTTASVHVATRCFLPSCQPQVNMKSDTRLAGYIRPVGLHTHPVSQFKVSPVQTIPTVSLYYPVG